MTIQTVSRVSPNIIRGFKNDLVPYYASYLESGGGYSVTRFTFEGTIVSVEEFESEDISGKLWSCIYSDEFVGDGSIVRSLEEVILVATLSGDVYSRAVTGGDVILGAIYRDNWIYYLYCNLEGEDLGGSNFRWTIKVARSRPDFSVTQELDTVILDTGTVDESPFISLKCAYAIDSADNVVGFNFFTPDEVEEHYQINISPAGTVSFESEYPDRDGGIYNQTHTGAGFSLSDTAGSAILTGKDLNDSEGWPGTGSFEALASNTIGESPYCLKREHNKVVVAFQDPEDEFTTKLIQATAIGNSIENNIELEFEYGIVVLL